MLKLNFYAINISKVNSSAYIETSLEKISTLKYNAKMWQFLPLWSSGCRLRKKK